MMGTFPQSADATIEKVRATYATREGEYGDSWATKNQVHTFLDATLKSISDRGVGADAFSPEEKRLIALSSMVDVKMTRMVGPYKEDTIVDLIAYLAVYNELRSQYEAAKSSDRGRV